MRWPVGLEEGIGLYGDRCFSEIPQQFQYHAFFLSAGAALAATMEFLQALVITGVSGLSFKSLLHVSHALPGNQCITGEFSYTYIRESDICINNSTDGPMVLVCLQPPHLHFQK